MSNREIKFRAWDKGDKVMLYNGIEFALAYLKKPSRNDLPTEKFIGYGARHARDFELMQFTGLKDKNGVEIYEGDIVRHSLRSQTNIKIVFNSNNGAFMFRGLEHHDCFIGVVMPTTEHVEVIGNIHESPELWVAK